MSVHGESGAIALDAFNEHIDREQPSWAAAAERTAATALRIGGGDDSRGAAEMKVDASASGATVEVTFTEVPDDSVEAVRYELVLRHGDDGLFRFEEGTRAQRCRSGRGGILSGGFSTEPCA